jgi:hypothetical protein
MEIKITCRCVWKILFIPKWLHKIESSNVSWINYICRRNCFMKHVIEGKTEEGYKWGEDEEKHASSYWMALKKQEETGNWKRKRFQAFATMLRSFGILRSIDLIPSRCFGITYWSHIQGSRNLWPSGLWVFFVPKAIRRLSTDLHLGVKVKNACSHTPHLPVHQTTTAFFQTAVV